MSWGQSWGKLQLSYTPPKNKSFVKYLYGGNYATLLEYVKKYSTPVIFKMERTYC